MPDLSVIVCVALDHRAPPDGLSKFKQCILACPQVEAVMEVSGTFDLIVHASLASLAEFLREMERLAAPLANFATRVESNFVGRTVDCHGADSVIWVPCADGRRRIEAGMINKIVAEGDYMRLFLTGSECLVHETIGHLLARLDPQRFVRLHRSTVVRTDFIERLQHLDRRWVAQLKDGTRYNLARSRVAAVLRLLTAESSSHEHSLANGAPTGDARPVLTETMKLETFLQG
ncbi:MULTISPECIES: LytTR family transcriptional regulator DNA-binding domain-containing protein [Sphingomonas]|uniref:LytTR family transcriptional regulator DNA-binding domain-containing protein n=1 Tax=Sphingomonas TaxID=13687 RepID=UPI0013B399CE|nr:MULTISPECIES: LytTR family transcriptional regulator DNA-binding domain-containing protein [Sphingomonas]